MNSDPASTARTAASTTGSESKSTQIQPSASNSSTVTVATPVLPLSSASQPENVDAGAENPYAHLLNTGPGWKDPNIHGSWTWDPATEQCQGNFTWVSCLVDKQRHNAQDEHPFLAPYYSGTLRSSSPPVDFVIVRCGWQLQADVRDKKYCVVLADFDTLAAVGLAKAHDCAPTGKTLPEDRHKLLQDTATNLKLHELPWLPRRVHESSDTVSLAASRSPRQHQQAVQYHEQASPHSHHKRRRVSK